MVSPLASRHSIDGAERGFTVVELMLALAILAILVGVAMPAYQSAVANQKVRTAAASLHSALLLARSEAIKLNRSVILRPADDEAWSNGWLVENPASPGDATALHRDRINEDGVTVSSDVDQVQFRASGRLSGAGGVTFELEAVSDSEKKRCVSIGLDGRPLTETGGC